MDYQLTINVHDAYSGQEVSDVTLVVSYVEGSTEIPIQPTSPGVYMCPDETTIYISASKTGYRPSYDNIKISGADATKGIYITPVNMPYSFDLYKADGNRRSQFQAHNFTATLWHYVGSEWVEVEQYVGSTTAAVYKGYFWSTCISGDKYKITFTHSDNNYFPIPDHEWTAGSANHGYPEATGAYYTWETYKTLFRLIFIDPQDVVLTPDASAFYSKIVASVSYSQAQYNSYVGGYLIGHNGVRLVYYKVTASLDGYDDVNLESTWQVDTVRDTDFNVVMSPAALTTDLTVSVADYRTGQTISDATIVVTNTSTGQVITPTSPGVYEVVYNRGYVYNVAVSKTGYDSSTMTITPTTADPVIADIALIPQPAYHIDVIAEDTKQPILGYTAKAYLDGSLIETSTNGDFYVAWDGTSTYSIVVTADGYQTYTYTGTAYPAAPLELIEKSTRLQFTVTDNVTGSSITPDTVIVRNHSEGTVIPATEDYYVVELGVQYDYIIQRSGYRDSTGTITATQRGLQVESVVMTLIPLETDLTLNITDKRRGTVIDDANIVVTEYPTQRVITPTGNKYRLVYNYGYNYTVSVSKIDYISVLETVTPTTQVAVTLDIELEKTLKYAKLYVTARRGGEALSDVDITVKDLYTGEFVTETDGYYSVIYNDEEPYEITAEKVGYYSYKSDVITPDSAADINYVAEMTKIPVYADMTVNVTDSETGTVVENATIVVTDVTAGETVEKTGSVYKLLAEEDHLYSVDVTAPKYYSSTITGIHADTTDPITQNIVLTKLPVYVPVTVVVIDATTSVSVDGTVVVYDNTLDAPVEKSDDGKYHVLIHDSITVTVTASGYTTYTETFLIDTEEPVVITAAMAIITGPYATVDDYMLLTGKTLTAEEIERVDALLAAVSDIIRYEGSKVGIDVDRAIIDDPNYGTTVKTVTIDVVSRVLRQSNSGEPMSQESQSALGYSWSGTYAIPGGGIAMSLMNNERKILGFRKQTLWGIPVWQAK